mgnify:CR=1 FL=1
MASGHRWWFDFIASGWLRGVNIPGFETVIRHVNAFAFYTARVLISAPLDPECSSKTTSRTNGNTRRVRRFSRTNIASDSVLLDLLKSPPCSYRERFSKQKKRKISCRPFRRKWYNTFCFLHRANYSSKTTHQTSPHLLVIFPKTRGKQSKKYFAWKMARLARTRTYTGW